jgi:hypothetical protein
MRSVISVLVIIGPVLTLGLLGKVTAVWPTLLAGVMAAIFINLNRFKSFRGPGGIEADVRDAVEKAYATIDNLRELAKPLIVSILHTITRSGRWGGMHIEQKQSFQRDLERIAISLGIAKDKEVLEANREYFRFHTWDFFYYFAQEVNKIKEIPEEVREKLLSLQKRETEEYPSRDEIKKILGNSYSKLSNECIEYLEDYLFYLKKRLVRRPISLTK